VPEFSVTLFGRSIVPAPADIKAGADAILGRRRLSVESAPLAPAAAAPMHATGAGMTLVGQAEFKPSPGGEPIAFPPGVEREVMRRFDPKGPLTREEFNQKFPQPTARQVVKDVRSGVNEASQETIKRLNKNIESINEQAEKVGLPTVPQIDPEFFGLVEQESSSIGNAASGFVGIVAAAEVMPAWRKDP
jgi:hypothetical protein